jgi:hypothetical protein
MIPRQPKPSPEEALNESDEERKSTEEKEINSAESETDEDREERYLKGPTAFSA